MADVHEHMRRILAEHRKKNPELAYRFIDSKPDELRIRTETDGFKIVKQEGSGTTGEIRVGDLILAARPRKEVDEERKREAEKVASQLGATERSYYSDINRDGGRGKWIAPLTPNEASKFGRRS